MRKEQTNTALGSISKLPRQTQREKESSASMFLPPKNLMYYFNTVLILLLKGWFPTLGPKGQEEDDDNARKRCKH